jgi:hypothetical protein
MIMGRLRAMNAQSRTSQNGLLTVGHIQGYIHGFLVLKDLSQKLFASGDITKTPDAIGEFVKTKSQQPGTR